MADSILRLKVESQEYDNKLKQATNGLTRYADECRKVGGTLEVVEKETLDYVRAIGQMDTTSRTATGKLAEMKKTFVELSAQYKQMTDAEKASPFGKALSESLNELKPRIMEAKQQLDDINKSMIGASSSSGGGLFAGLGDKMSGALQVFAGNMMTKAAGAVAELGSEIFASVQQGIELAKQGEGIRIAFERLGRGDILDGLRQATHGTVTDLELMKAAVKFNDFKLPVEELGTMLAFAQQKAKDTGQSVDYMVDSIVTGLGRKSLMILDNLGLSAAQIKERMKETGDMTKAVADIIREEMAKAGDYVETAADRAAKADVELKNAMEELGRTFQPLTDASDSLWNSIKVGALNALNTAVKPLIQALAEAGTLGQGARSSAGFNNLGGNSKVDRMIGRLGNGKSAGAYSIYKQQLAEFDKYINNKRFQIAAFGGDNSSVAKSAKAKLQTELDGALKMRAEYVKRAQELHNQVPSPYEPSTTNTTKGSGSGGSGKAGGGSIKTEQTELQKNQQTINELTQEYVSISDNANEVTRARQDEIQKEIQLLEQRNNLLKLYAEQAQGKLQGGDIQTTGLGSSNFAGSFKNIKIEGLSENQMEKVRKGMQGMNQAAKESQKTFMGAASAVSAMGSALSSIEDPGVQIMGIIGQAIANIALGFAQASAKEGKGGIWYWIAATAAGLATMVTTISSIHSATGYANGGIIEGNSYSGDNIGGLVDGSQLVGLNAGELVLTHAQQNVLANELQGNDLQNLNLHGVVEGEKILLVVNRSLKRKGKGELVTWKD